MQIHSLLDACLAKQYVYNETFSTIVTDLPCKIKGTIFCYILFPLFVAFEILYAYFLLTHS